MINKTIDKLKDKLKEKYNNKVLLAKNEYISELIKNNYHFTAIKFKLLGI